MPMDLEKKLKDQQELENMIKNFISTEIEWLPINNVDVSQDKAETVTQLLETLEEEDDVQNVYTNFKIRKNKWCLLLGLIQE